jgi:hypothetical protein
LPAVERARPSALRFAGFAGFAGFLRAAMRRDGTRAWRGGSRTAVGASAQSPQYTTSQLSVR